jgi:glutamine synthetase
MENLFRNYEELKNYVDDKGIKIVDFKIVTLAGKWNHLSIPVTRLNE